MAGNAGAPASFCADDLSVLERLGVFTEIPDIPELILREIIEGIFLQLAVDLGRVGVLADGGEVFPEL